MVSKFAQWEPRGRSSLPESDSVTLGPAEGHACGISNTAFLNPYILQPLSWSHDKGC